MYQFGQNCAFIPECTLATNYFKILQEPSWNICHYVSFFMFISFLSIMSYNSTPVYDYGFDKNTCY